MPEYEFVLMYEPRNGTPVSVPVPEVQARLNEGFRKEKPGEDTVLKPLAGLVPVAVSPSATIAAREMTAVEINATSLKDLSQRLGLSTPQAREVKEKRPYKDLEDLIAKCPEISNWANLAHLISFAVQEEPSEEEEKKVNSESDVNPSETPQATTNEDLTPSGTSKAGAKKIG